MVPSNAGRHIEAKPLEALHKRGLSPSFTFRQMRYGRIQSFFIHLARAFILEGLFPQKP